ncbi:MAG: hypothetical protein RIS09_777 [Actinomycetota bacterium]
MTTNLQELETTNVARSTLQRRMRLSRAIMLLTIFSLIVGMVQAQAFTDPSDIQVPVSSETQTVTVPAIRGQILDRNGNTLAMTVDSRNVIADQTLVKDPKSQGLLIANITGQDPALVIERLSGVRRYSVIARSVTPSQWEKIEQLQLPGIFSERSLSRSYPEGELAANILGFVNSEGLGLGGLEYSMEKVLGGINGERTFSTVPGLSTADQSLTAAVNGQHIKLTIDRDIQWFAQETIAAQVRATRAKSGVVIVMNPKTGEILAMATAPTFDPNNIIGVESSLLGNRAVSDAFEPGSTGKVITLAAALEEEKVSLSSKFKIPSGLRRGDKRFTDAHAHGGLKLTLTGIMAHSSNIGSILVSETLSDGVFYNYLKKFGIGSKTSIQLPAESAGSLPEVSKWSLTTKPTLSFGQGYSLNALQATSIFATIANNGVRVQPTIIQGIQDGNSRFDPMPSTNTERVISSQTAESVRHMMEYVVSNKGTAPQAKIPGYRISGKTGTAQAFDPKCGCYRGYIASFIGIAPSDNPELVVGVFLDRPQSGIYGGSLAGPVFKKVTSFALQQLRIPPTGLKKPKLRLKW